MSQVPISKKDHLFKIENAHLFIVLWSLQLAHPFGFQLKMYIILKLIKV